MRIFLVFGMILFLTASSFVFAQEATTTTDSQEVSGNSEAVSGTNWKRVMKEIKNPNLPGRVARRKGMI